MTQQNSGTQNVTLRPPGPEPGHRIFQGFWEEREEEIRFQRLTRVSIGAGSEEFK
jgi:hypothetical protein